MTDKPFLADKLRSGQAVVTGWSLLSEPMVPELFARAGYEAVTIDLQHGMYDFDDACTTLAAIALGGAHRIARIPVGDNALAGRLVDMGAECLIAPMINSLKEAEEFARAVKYPPEGERSWSPFRAAMLSEQTSDQYLKNANRQTLALAMIETEEAMDALDDILTVDSLDGVFVGPSDLSLTLSKGAALDPNGARTSEACADIAQKTLAAGKLAGIFCLNADKVEEAYHQGFRLMSHGIDTIFLDHSARTCLREVAWLGDVKDGPATGY
ncbi:HpcH/HpaI aldolase/citrate lyase family protein [Labrenzia sp. VG12]|uniref:HpcH/HpaI aldolase family protein n=1 Tax=Labrenzia sp. VG12 TaxID=2021862 RepID=UPI000B8C25F2|nr:aldolase/citrate lyase family protein [Labrenzia sp. VG12]ASP36739.1 hydroxyacid aldolase [Labrenzia sp. VG12]